MAALSPLSPCSRSKALQPLHLTLLPTC